MEVLVSSRKYPQHPREGAMAGTETRYEHIVLDDRGIPVLKGTTLKVIDLVVERLAYGWSPEELVFQHPSLTLGQIY